MCLYSAIVILFIFLKLSSYKKISNIIRPATQLKTNDEYIQDVIVPSMHTFQNYFETFIVTPEAKNFKQK